jgi:hypothetical protein
MKKGEIQLPVIEKMEAPRNKLDTINEKVSKITNDIQQTRQQCVSPQPPDEPPMSPANGSSRKRKIEK